MNRKVQCQRNLFYKKKLWQEGELSCILFNTIESKFDFKLPESGPTKK